MISRLATHLMLRPEDIQPSHPGWSVIGVFNPGVIRCGDRTVILARVAERPTEQRPGWTPHPSWSPKDGYVVDWVENEHLRGRIRAFSPHSNGACEIDVYLSPPAFASRDGRTIDDLNGTVFLPAQRNGRVRTRRSAHHEYRRSLLHHVCGRIAPWPGDCFGLDDRFQNARATWHYFLPGK